MMTFRIRFIGQTYTSLFLHDLRLHQLKIAWPMLWHPLNTSLPEQKLNSFGFPLSQYTNIRMPMSEKLAGDLGMDRRPGQEAKWVSLGAVPDPENSLSKPELFWGHFLVSVWSHFELPIWLRLLLSVILTWMVLAVAFASCHNFSIVTGISCCCSYMDSFSMVFIGQYSRRWLSCPDEHWKPREGARVSLLLANY